MRGIILLTREINDGSTSGQNEGKRVNIQGFLIKVCVAIYAVLVQNIPMAGNVHSAIWDTVGYTLLLCFAFFKTGSLAKSVFSAH